MLLALSHLSFAAVPQRNVGPGSFPTVQRDSNDRRIGNIIVLKKHGFEPGRCDLHRIVFDEALLAVDNPEVIVFGHRNCAAEVGDLKIGRVGADVGGGKLRYTKATA